MEEETLSFDYSLYEELYIHAKGRVLDCNPIWIWIPCTKKLYLGTKVIFLSELVEKLYHFLKLSAILVAIVDFSISPRVTRGQPPRYHYIHALDE